MLLSAERIATTAGDKAALLRAAGVPADVPAAVDLETAAWARLAGGCGIPDLAVRAISDSAQETLPLDFNRFRDAGGSVLRSWVALHALGHPSVIAELRRLRRRLRRCAERLADFACDLLTAPPAGGDAPVPIPVGQ